MSQHGSTGPTERRRELAQKYAAALWTQRNGDALRDLETLGWGDGWLASGLTLPVLVKILACERSLLWLKLGFLLGWWDGLSGRLLMKIHG